MYLGECALFSVCLVSFHVMWLTILQNTSFSFSPKFHELDGNTNIFIYTQTPVATPKSSGCGRTHGGTFANYRYKINLRAFYNMPLETYARTDPATATVNVIIQDIYVCELKGPQFPKMLARTKFHNSAIDSAHFCLRTQFFRASSWSQLHKNLLSHEHKYVYGISFPQCCRRPQHHIVGLHYYHWDRLCILYGLKRAEVVYYFLMLFLMTCYNFLPTTLALLHLLFLVWIHMNLVTQAQLNHGSRSQSDKLEQQQTARITYIWKGEHLH